MSATLTVVGHPLVQHKLALLRDRRTSTQQFRQLLRELGMLLAYEVTRELPLATATIETPLATLDAPTLEGHKLCLISILRAGNGLLEGMLDLLPFARVGHVGLYRDHTTLAAVQYYFKVPDRLHEARVIVLDPMLATGNSAIAALDRLRRAGARTMMYVCVLAAPEGVKALQQAHPEVPIITAAVDSHLDERGYIVPGLGDAGDRLYGTK